MPLGPAYGATDVTINNAVGDNYITGSEFVDGSIRWRHTPPDEFAHIEKRESGVWNDTGIRLSPSTLSLGRGFHLEAASSHLILAALGADRQIVVAASFDDTGSQAPQTTLLGAKIERLVVQPDESLEVTSTTHIGLAPVAVTAFGEAVYFKTGSVGATAPVLLQSTQGVPPNDVLFLQREFPASAFPANSEVKLEFESSVIFPVGTQLNPKLTSVNPFSILHNAGGTRFWTAVDLQPKRDEDLLSHPTGLSRILMGEDGNSLSNLAGEFLLMEA